MSEGATVTRARSAGALAPGSPACPRCGARGRKVAEVTPRSLLAAGAVERLAPGTTLYFCRAPRCDVVYFGEGGSVFRTGDLRVPVFPKFAGRDGPVCYCFGYTVADIREDVRRTGGAAILADIAGKCRQNLQRCEKTNPQGSCCLGNVRAVIREVRREGEAPARLADASPQCCGPGCEEAGPEGDPA